MKYILTILLFTSVVCISKAQDNCALILENAQKLYDNGMIEQIPEMLEPCLKSGFNSDERLQAYKLIILSHIFNNNTGEADKNMLAFLKKYPEYELSATDPAEFVQLFNTYRTNPFASIIFRGGINFPNVKVLQSYRWDKRSAQSFYSSVMSYYGGGFFELNLIGKLNGGIGLSYMTNEWNYVVPELNMLSTGSYNESETLLGIPLYLSYKIANFKLYEFSIASGYEFQYLLTAEALPKKIDALLKPISSPTYSIISKRKKVDHNGFISIIADRKMKKSSFKIEIGYLRGSQNKMIIGERYTSQTVEIDDEKWKTTFVDNDFRIDRFFINIGVSIKFYKPEKK